LVRRQFRGLLRGPARAGCVARDAALLSRSPAPCATGLATNGDGSKSASRQQKAYYAADKSSDQQSDEGLLLNGIGNDGRSFTHLVSSLAIGLLCRHGRLACPSLPPHSPPFAVMSEAQTGAPPLLERTFSPAMGHPAARPARLHWAQAGLSAFRHPDGKPRCPRDWCGQNSFPKRVHVGLHRLATL
jgi:hypothetical protein